MAKKRKGKQRSSPPPHSPRFAVGTKVYVKPGTRDPDYVEFPMGGWSGTVAEVDQRSRPPVCLIRWDERTLKEIDPVYRRRCERDDLVFDCAWVLESDLEPFTGALVPIEQPTKVEEREIDLGDEEDRIRVVFGLGHDDPLPPVNAETLERYRRYLDTTLSFPFFVQISVERGPLQSTRHRAKVVDLSPAEDSEDGQGLMCQVSNGTQTISLPLEDMEPESPVHQQAISDYAFWLQVAPDKNEVVVFTPTRVHTPDIIEGQQASRSERVDVLQTSGEASTGEWFESVSAAAAKWDPSGLQSVVALSLPWVILGLLTGGLAWLGMASLEGAVVAMEVLGAIGGFLGLILGGILGVAAMESRNGGLIGLVFGGIAGACLGACGGILILLVFESLLSVLAGAILGGLLGRWVWRYKKSSPRVFLCALLGALLWPLGFVIWRDPASVAGSAGLGILIGGGVGVILAICFLVSIVVVSYIQNRWELRK